MEFSRARLNALQTMRADPKVKDRAQKTHDALEDFTTVYNELNDNLDSFLDRDYDLRKMLKAQGFTVLLVEQNFQFAATVADRHYVMEHGRVVDEFSTPELKANMEKVHDYLGV